MNTSANGVHGVPTKSNPDPTYLLNSGLNCSLASRLSRPHHCAGVSGARLTFHNASGVLDVSYRVSYRCFGELFAGISRIIRHWNSIELQSATSWQSTMELSSLGGKR